MLYAICVYFPKALGCKTRWVRSRPRVFASTLSCCGRSTRCCTGAVFAYPELCSRGPPRPHPPCATRVHSKTWIRSCCSAACPSLPRMTMMTMRVFAATSAVAGPDPGAGGLLLWQARASIWHGTIFPLTSTTVSPMAWPTTQITAHCTCSVPVDCFANPFPMRCRCRVLCMGSESGYRLAFSPIPD